MYPKIDSFIKFGNPTGITGKRDGSTNSEVIFPDGLLSAGSVCDELYEDKAIKRVDKVDLGTLTWNDRISSNLFFVDHSIGNVIRGKCVMPLFIWSNASYFPSMVLNSYAFATASGDGLCIVTNKYKSLQSFKQAMSGVYLYYELANPITYALDTPLDLSYKVDDFGTESILSANVSTINTTKFNGSIKYALNAADTIRNLQTNYVSTYENQRLDEERKFNARKNIGVDNIIDKADKEGIYPDLVAGNLVDGKNTGSAQVIMGLRTSCGTDSIVDDGYAQIKRIKGNSIVWNQLAPTITEVKINYGVTYTPSQNKSITANGTASGNSVCQLIHNIVQFHKYLVIGCPKGGGEETYRLRFLSGNISEFGNGRIFTANGTVASLAVNVRPGYTANNLVFWPQLFDLTQMFGPGNEPTTVEEFGMLFPHIK